MSSDEKTVALASAALFMIAFLAAIVGGTLFSGRKQLKWAKAQSSSYLYWERSVWIVGYIILLMGTFMLTELLEMRGERVLSELGGIGFLFGAVVVVIVEGLALSGQSWSSYLLRLSVILLLLSQAIIGLSMLQVDVFAAWLGWLTVFWNLFWFILLLRAKDPYYPALYFVMPFVLAIGIVIAG